MLIQTSLINLSAVSRESIDSCKWLIPFVTVTVSTGRNKLRYQSLLMCLKYATPVIHKWDSKRKDSFNTFGKCFEIFQRKDRHMKTLHFHRWLVLLNLSTAVENWRAFIFFVTLSTPLMSYLPELGHVLKCSELITFDLISKKVWKPE